MTDESVRTAMYLRGWSYVMVLDSAVICRTNDGRNLALFCRSCLEHTVFRPQGPPECPLHPNLRCHMIP